MRSPNPAFTRGGSALLTVRSQVSSSYESDMVAHAQDTLRKSEWSRVLWAGAPVFQGCFVESTLEQISVEGSL